MDYFEIEAIEIFVDTKTTLAPRTDYLTVRGNKPYRCARPQATYSKDIQQARKADTVKASLIANSQGHYTESNYKMPIILVIYELSIILENN